MLDTETTPVSLRIGACRQEMFDFFDTFVSYNPDYRFEQSAEGEIIVMLPTGGKNGIRGSEIIKQVAVWANTHGGLVFDSQTLFKLPNGAKRGPDCAWVTQERWNALSNDEQETYPPLAPDLIVELRSKSDSLNLLRQKMEEYINQGVRLGWLLDPYLRMAHIYQPGKQVIELRQPHFLDGADVATGLKLDVLAIFDK